jgi:hypothetical protein
MRNFAILLTTIFLACSGIVFAQTDAPPQTTYVHKDFTIKTSPKDAEIFRISNNGSEEKLGVGPLPIRIDKDEIYVVEVRREGYQPIRQVYQRQKGAQEEVNINLTTRLVQINAFPADAHIYVNGNDFGTSPQPALIKNGESITVDVKKVGYVPQTRSFYNQGGKETPPVSDNIKLEDRVVSVTAVPNTATIYADGKKQGIGNANVVIHRDECAKVSVEQNGYSTEQKTYCNKDNEPAPPVNDEIALKDREVEINVTPSDAEIDIDGKKMAAGTYKMKIIQGECKEVYITKNGFSRFGAILCNQTDKTGPQPAYHVTLNVDEAFKESDQSSSGYANQKFEVPVKKELAPDVAWKVLISIISSKFNEYKQLDANSCYLTTNWTSSNIFNDRPTEGSDKAFPQIIRTRVLVSLATAPSATSPLTYHVTIQSEISKIDRDCTSKYKVPPVSSDECFQPFEYVLRTYSELISQIQQRMTEK